MKIYSMDDITLIYNNKFGLAFKWTKESLSKKKVQLVFRDTGLYLSTIELKSFAKNINKCLQSTNCSNCPQNENCRNLLVDSPIKNVTFAMNKKEINDMKDLVEGTLFHLNLDQYLERLVNG
ncbi:hypothetical protein ACFSSG_09160 [Euzebyella marina]|nr:hypothetical protein [Euzebyella marina]